MIRLHVIGFMAACLISGCSDPPSQPSNADPAPKVEVDHRPDVPVASESDLGHLDAENVASIQKKFELVQADPDDADAWAELARTYHVNLLYEPAMETYRIAGQLNPRDPAVQYQMAIVLERLGKVDDAIAMIEAMHVWDARYAPSHRRLADWYRQQGEMGKAVASARRGVALAPRDISQRLVLCQILVDNGDFAKAVKLLRPLQRLPDPPPFVYTLLSRCHRGLGNHELANGCQAYAGPRPEDMPDPWFMNVVDLRTGMSTELLRAQSLLDHGDARKAKAIFQSLLLRDPDNVHVVVNLSTCQLASGDPDGAEATILEYLHRHPADALAMKRQIALAVHRLRSSNALAEHEGWDVCSTLGESYIRQYPEDFEGYVYRGEVDRSRGRHEAALGWFEQAEAAPDSEASAYIDSMVECLLRLNRSQEAIAQLRRAVESNPTNVDMTITLARLEAEHDDFDAAVSRLEAMLVYRPGDPALQEALASMGRSNEGG